MTPEQLWQAYLAAKTVRDTASNAFRVAEDSLRGAEAADANASLNLLQALTGGNQATIDAASVAKIQTTIALNLSEMTYSMAKNNLNAAQANVNAAYRELTQRR